MKVIFVIIIIYLALTFLVAWIFSRRESVEAYFINKRKTSLWPMTCSTVATVVGAGATVGVVAEVYNTGISFGLQLISIAVGMLICGLLARRIKQIGDTYNAYTIVDFFEKRFDKKTKILTSYLQLFLLIIWIGIQAIAIASLATVLTGIAYTSALLLTAAATILYTAMGGLKVDIITDFIQFWIIVTVFLVMAVVGYQHVGSVANLLAQLPSGHLDPFAFGGVSWFVGIILIGGFLYLGNPTHWQRIFSAANQETAAKSFYLAIPITTLLAVVVVFFGLLAAVVLPGGIAKETALFSLMKATLPPWLVGFGFASILAVIMSSVDSLLIGGSTIIHKALFSQRQIDSQQELRYARLLTVGFGLVGFILAFFIPNIITLSLLVGYLALIFVPPIIAGLYSKKTSGQASFFSILVPTLALFILFPFLQEQVFIVTTLLGITIITLYDKAFKRRA